MDKEESKPAIPEFSQSWWLLELQKLKIETVQGKLDALEEKVTLLESHNRYLQEQNQLLLSKITQEQSLLVYINNSMNQPNDKSQNISVGGDFNINATQSVVNLRDIIGTVNSAIEQISSTAAKDQNELKQLLQELTTAIEMEASLDNDEKAEAANQVKKIAEAAQNPDDAGLTTKAKRAVGFLETIAKGLEPASKLVHACQKGLPLILGLLG